MRSIETHIDIDAQPAQVWQVLTDFASYGREGWNAYILSIDVDPRPRGHVRAVTKSPLLDQRDLKAQIISATFPELSWEAKLPVPGILHAKHYFRIEQLSPTTSRFIQGETVSGILTATVFHLVEKSEPGFLIMNAAIKQRAEALDRQVSAFDPRK